VTFDEFLQQACPPLELAWRKYRRRSARHRVDRRLRELGLDDYGAYLDLLCGDPEEAGRLGDLMRVTVSRFFREEERWIELMTLVLPSLLATAEGSTLCAWSVGCCAGEEPYTLALLWLALPEVEKRGLALQVVATDVDSAVLERADQAVYTRSSLKEVPEDLRERWFSTEVAGRRRLDPRVRSRVRFLRHNLMQDPPPVECDLALCRYLAFTYYEGWRRAEAVRRLAGAVRPGGALMIGGKEALGPAEEAFFTRWPGTVGVYSRTPCSAY
jgi:chemotaxis protein methyltransferase CheR